MPVRTWHSPGSPAPPGTRRQHLAGLFLDAAERAQLCDLLGELSPGAPTLLAPWTARDLAAHLVLRERDPLAGPGLVLPGAWRRLAQQRQSALAGRDFSWLIAALRSGPPPGFFRLAWVHRLPSLNEFFVHHEDLRRANGWPPAARAGHGRGPVAQPQPRTLAPGPAAARRGP